MDKSVSSHSFKHVLYVLATDIDIKSSVQQMFFRYSFLDRQRLVGAGTGLGLVADNIL